MKTMTLPIIKHISFLRALFSLVCFVGTIMLCLVTYAPAASASTNIATPDTPISVISFDVGRLEQNLNDYGQWTEYDFRGQERYKFREISSNKTALRLRGEQGKVELFINLKAKTISGEWPGHPMSQLYKITTVNKTGFAVKTPKLDMPSVKIPAVDVPIVKTPNDLAEFTPATSPKASDFNSDKVAEVSFKGGSFIKKDGLDWVERASDNSVTQFRKIGHDATSIYLFNTTKAIFVKLDLANRIALISEGETLKELHELTEITESKPYIDENTDKTVFNRKLSIRERFDCRRKGGSVVRAGLLGAERCTMRFTDGGNVCLDSGDCEGKCFTLAETGSENVTGKCQMNDNPFGCRAEVINGVAEFMVCVD